MKIQQLILAILSCFLSLEVFAYGLGVSTYPFEVGQKVAQGEITSVINNGRGFGVQGRYVQRLNEKLVIDAGIGLAGGERSNRIFAAGDFTIFPDYKMQPRTSIRAYIENASEFKTRRNILGLAPTASKGFSFWGKEAYPFVALPLELNLNGATSSFETAIRASAGVTGLIEVNDMPPMVGSAELTINLKDSFTGFFVGLAYQFN